MPEAFAEYVVPKRYGRVYVQQPDGSETEHKGGTVALMPASQAADIGAVPTKPAPLADEADDAAIEDAPAAPKKGRKKTVE